MNGSSSSAAGARRVAAGDRRIVTGEGTRNVSDSTRSMTPLARSRGRCVFIFPASSSSSPAWTLRLSMLPSTLMESLSQRATLDARGCLPSNMRHDETIR